MVQRTVLRRKTALPAPKLAQRRIPKARHRRLRQLPQVALQQKPVSFRPRKDVRGLKIPAAAPRIRTLEIKGFDLASPGIAGGADRRTEREQVIGGGPPLRVPVLRPERHPGTPVQVQIGSTAVGRQKKPGFLKQLGGENIRRPGSFVVESAPCRLAPKRAHEKLVHGSIQPLVFSQKRRGHQFRVPTCARSQQPFRIDPPHRAGCTPSKQFGRDLVDLFGAEELLENDPHGVGGGMPRTPLKLSVHRL